MIEQNQDFPMSYLPTLDLSYICLAEDIGRILAKYNMENFAHFLDHNIMHACMKLISIWTQIMTYYYLHVYILTCIREIAKCNVHLIIIARFTSSIPSLLKENPRWLISVLCILPLYTSRLAI